jgi:hypothetical protein
VSVRLLLLVAGTAAFWLLVGLPARHLGGGDAALIQLGAGLLLCLVPSVVTLLWAEHVARKDPRQQVLVLLGGSGVRLFGVLLGGVALVNLVEFFRDRPGFWTWLLVCYFFTLTLELTLLLTGRKPAKA